jgi:hypothetical protein
VDAERVARPDPRSRQTPDHRRHDRNIIRCIGVLTTPDIGCDAIPFQFALKVQ